MEFLALRTPKDETIVHVAAAGGYYELCQFFIKDVGLPVDMQDLKGDTPLHHAVRAGHTEIVKFICTRNPDISIQNSDGYRALNLAVINGYIEVMKILLPLHRRCHSIDSPYDHLSPLQLAARDARHEIVKELLKHVNPEFRTYHPFFSPLQLAITAKSFECMRLLIEYGASINSGYRRTPLSMAAEEGEAHIVKFLLERGADPNVDDAGGLLAIERAAINGHVDIVRHLLPHSKRIFNFPDCDKDIVTIMQKIHSKDVNEMVRCFKRDALNESLSMVVIATVEAKLYWYSQVLYVDPCNEEALVGRCFSWVNVDMFDQALLDANEYMRCCHNKAKALWLRSRVYRKKQDHANAFADILDAIVLAPFDEEIQVAYSAINKEIGGYEGSTSS